MSPHDPKGAVADKGEEEVMDVPASTTPETTSTTATTAEELKATASMCHHCFDVLVQELQSKSSNKQQNNRKIYHHQSVSALSSSGSDLAKGKPLFAESLPNESVECPFFITWETRSSSSSSSKRGSSSNNNFELRGCIGTLAPKVLLSSVGEYALISALRDKRFDPVAMDELPLLSVAVSLLVQYEECEHCHDWTVGVHGIIIRFWASDAYAAAAGEGGGGGGGSMELSATFLPEVAEQQGWDQTKTVSQLIRKAGYKGTVTDRLLQRIECTRYQSSKHRVTYEEYVQHLGHPIAADPTTSNPAFITGIIHGGGNDNDTAPSSSNKDNNCRIM